MALPQISAFLTIAKPTIYFAIFSFVLLFYPQFAKADDLSQANGTLALAQGCTVIKTLDEAAPQWFSDLRGKVIEEKDGATTYEASIKFPNGFTQIVEHADGNTNGYIGMGSGKTDEDHRKFYEGMVELVKTCITSKIVNSDSDMSNKYSMNTTYILSNNACVDMAGINFFGKRMIAIYFWTPDSSSKACDALR